MLWIIKILLINAIILFVILSNTAYSQKDSNLRNTTIQSNLIGWDKIITIIGATGLISAVGSGLFNIYITNRQLKGQLANKYKELNQQHQDKLSELDKQHTDNLKHLGAQLEKTIEQMKYGRQLNEIQDKLNIYASFAFDLKKLRGLRRNYPVPPQNKIDEISKDIDLLIRP